MDPETLETIGRACTAVFWVVGTIAGSTVILTAGFGVPFLAVWSFIYEHNQEKGK